MPQPFHFAFFVRDLDSTRRFYGEILGCREGRSTDTWVDFDFFGNQISAHTTGQVTPTQNTGKVENILVPMPHFGAILKWEEFEALAGRIRTLALPGSSVRFHAGDCDKIRRELAGEHAGGAR